MKKSSIISLALMAGLTIGCSHNKKVNVEPQDIIIHTDTNTEDTVDTYIPNQYYPVYSPYTNDYFSYQMFYYFDRRVHDDDGYMRVPAYRGVSKGSLARARGFLSFSSGLSRGITTRGGFGRSMSFRGVGA